MRSIARTVYLVVALAIVVARDAWLTREAVAG